jgi:hypothetical protein
MSEFNSSERDSSGTTEGLNEMKPEGDGADSPTRANEVSEAARPKNTQNKRVLFVAAGY